jgi:hypothetical protein
MAAAISKREAALRIQRRFRGYAARKRYRELQERIHGSAQQDKTLVKRTLYKARETLLLLVHLLAKTNPKRSFCIQVKLYDMTKRQYVFAEKRTFSQLGVQVRSQEEALQIAVGIFDNMRFSGNPQADFGTDSAAMMEGLQHIEETVHQLKLQDHDEDNDDQRMQVSYQEEDEIQDDFGEGF